MNSNKRISALFLALMSAPQYVMASSIYVAADTYEYETQLGMFDIEYRPAGLVLGGNFDLTDTLYAQIEVGKWDDQASTNPGGDESNFDSDLINLGIGYQTGAWGLLISYTGIEDDLNVRHGLRSEFLTTGNIDSMSVRANVSYEQVSG